MTAARPLVIYHANCPDGFTAAWVARKALGPDCEFVSANYGEEPPDVAGRRVYILDFSYKRPAMRRILSSAQSVVVLDHHKTAEVELAGIHDEFCLRPDLITNSPGSDLPVVHFDMNKSGCRLTWEHFHGQKPAPWIVGYVEDRDLWRWSLDSSREINAAIGSYPRTFDQWDRFGLFDYAHAYGWLRGEGAAILRCQGQLVDDICKSARVVNLGDGDVLAANTSVLFGDVAGKLAVGRPYGVAWFQRRDGMIQWSLRSESGGLDVSEVASRFGGGGHRNAAGFQTDSASRAFGTPRQLGTSA